MSDTLLLEIVTPTGVALKEQVTELTVPGLTGEFGVLAGHLPLLSALRPGLVTYRKGGETFSLAIAHGFAEIEPNKALVLTDRFAKKDTVDVVRVRLRLKEVDEELAHWQGELTDPRRTELIEEEQWLATELELIGDAPPPTVREDTRFLASHAESLPEAEMVEVSEPDDSLTDHHGPGSGFPDPR